MKPTTTILIGGPLQSDEAAFLRVLCTDFSNTDLLILANFLVGDRQVDFLVVTPAGAALIELKRYSRPMFGQRNGDWTLRDASGKNVPASNGYQQTLTQIYALSDAMRSHAKKCKRVPTPTKEQFYSNFSAFVTIFPELHPDSALTRGDRKVTVDSYANVRDAVRAGHQSTWTMSDWSTFATKHLNLTAASIEAATDSKALSAQNELDAYRMRLRALLATGLGPLLPQSGTRCYGTGIISQLNGPLNYLLFGPTGSAKTFHLHHLAIQLSQGSVELPLFIDSKRFRGGDFWSLLRQSIAPFFAGDPKQLLEATKRAGMRPVLLVDALNECPAAFRSDLLKGTQAFALHFDARVIVTGHESATELAGLTVVPLPIDLPDALQKRQIYAFHAGFPPVDSLDKFCAEFTNAYDLAVAGRCHRDGPSPKSRLELYDRYVIVHLPPPNSVVATALLRHIAGEMGDSVSMILSRDKCETLAARFLDRSNAPLRILDDIFDSSLVQVTAETFAFEHELLLTYFRAEHLRRSAPSIRELSTEMRRPRNEQLMEFVLPRAKQADEILCLLDAVNDFYTLVTIARGQHGELARASLLLQCETFVARALRDLGDISIDLNISTTDDGKRHIGYVTLTGTRRWSARDALLCKLLPHWSLDSRMQEKMLALLDGTERFLREATYKAADEAHVKRSRAWSQTFHQYGGISDSNMMELPYKTVLSTLRSLSMMRKQVGPITSQPTRAQLLSLTGEHPPRSYAFFLLLEDTETRGAVDLVEENLDLIEKAFTLRVDAIELQALHFLHCMNSTIRDAQPQYLPRVAQILESMRDGNMLWNSMVAEVQASYGILELAVTAADALEQMHALLLPSDEAASGEPGSMVSILMETSGSSADEVRQGLARGHINCFFEDFYQGVYYEAYTSLSTSQQRELLTLAANCKDPGINTDWILGELLSLGDKDTLPVFERYASTINAKSPMPQAEVGGFVIAIRGCAQWSAHPPTYRGDGSDLDDAWAAIGASSFYVYRSRWDPSTKVDSRDWFSRLQGPSRLAAGVTLCELQRSSWTLESKKDAPIDALLTNYPAEILGVIHYCIENRHLMNDLARFGRDADVIACLFDLLGHIGNSVSGALLRSLVDDPRWGKHALRTLKVLQPTLGPS